jgi:hypothetical protein
VAVLPHACPASNVAHATYMGAAAGGGSAPRCLNLSRRIYTPRMPADEIESIDALGEEQDLRAALRRLMSVLGASFEQRAHLAKALESRIVIEQAKGMLAERLRISLDEAFALLRQTARSRRVRIHDLAREVLERPETPAALLATLQGTLLAEDAS